MRTGLGKLTLTPALRSVM